MKQGKFNILEQDLEKVINSLLKLKKSKFIKNKGKGGYNVSILCDLFKAEDSFRTVISIIESHERQLASKESSVC